MTVRAIETPAEFPFRRFPSQGGKQPRGKDAARAKSAKSPGLSNYLTSSRVFILVRGRATLAETSEVIPLCYRRAGDGGSHERLRSLITVNLSSYYPLTGRAERAGAGGRGPGAEGGEGTSQESRRSESAAHLFDSSWLPGVPDRRFIPVTISRSHDLTISRSHHPTVPPTTSRTMANREKQNGS